jgi:sugar/nucleoside kinase (ribokinase family)
MDVVGIGLANIDLVSHVGDNFLKSHRIVKGKAQKLDELSFARLRADLNQFDAIPGGCAANTLCGMAAVGIPTVFYGKIGGDSFESLYRASFTEYSVRFGVAAAPQESSQCAVLVTPDGERSFAFTDGASWDLGPGDIDEEIVKNAAMIYCEIYMLDFAEGLAKKVIDCAEKHKIPMVMKMNDQDFAVRHAQKIRALADAGILSLLVGNNFNMPSLTKTFGTDETVEAFRTWPCDVLITAGPGGAYYIAGGEAVHYSVQVVQKPKNTTGAGDQFLAGFLTGRLDGKPVRDCIDHAASCARTILMHDTPRPPLVNRHSIRF